MLIYICSECRGNGLARVQPERRPFVKCPHCGGTGYPPGYTPPTLAECARYSFPDSELARVGT